MTPFGQFLARPSTTILLNQMLADNARVDEQQPKSEPPTGPRQCCAEFGAVRECDGKIDWIECKMCSYQWFAPCADLERPA